MSSGNKCDCCEPEECDCPRCTSGCAEGRAFSGTLNGTPIALDFGGGSGEFEASVRVAILDQIPEYAGVTCVQEDVEAPLCRWIGGYIDGDDTWQVVAVMFLQGGATKMRVVARVSSIADSSLYTGSDQGLGGETIDCDALGATFTLAKCVGDGQGSVGFSMVSV